MLSDSWEAPYIMTNPELHWIARWGSKEEGRIHTFCSGFKKGKALGSVIQPPTESKTFRVPQLQRYPINGTLPSASKTLNTLLVSRAPKLYNILSG